MLLGNLVKISRLALEHHENHICESFNLPEVFVSEGFEAQASVRLLEVCSKGHKNLRPLAFERGDVATGMKMDVRLLV